MHAAAPLLHSRARASKRHVLRSCSGLPASLWGGSVRRRRWAPSCSARQLIEWSAGAPVERQKSASLARCRRRHLGPLDDNDVDPAPSEEVCDSGSNHAASANYDLHDVSTDIYKGAVPAQARFIGYWCPIRNSEGRGLLSMVDPSGASFLRDRLPENSPFRSRIPGSRRESRAWT